MYGISPRPEGFEPTTIGIGIRYSIRAELRAVIFSMMYYTTSPNKCKVLSEKFPGRRKSSFGLFFASPLIFTVGMCYTISCIVYIAETKTIRSPVMPKRAALL